MHSLSVAGRRPIGSRLLLAWGLAWKLIGAFKAGDAKGWWEAVETWVDGTNGDVKFRCGSLTEAKRKKPFHGYPNFFGWSLWAGSSSAGTGEMFPGAIIGDAKGCGALNIVPRIWFACEEEVPPAKSISRHLGGICEGSERKKCILELAIRRDAGKWLMMETADGVRLTEDVLTCRRFDRTPESGGTDH
ncbi:uncharacterized protein PAC_09871 [Phialocephala subalpina]|uniref:Uncharacterized protein n=1 Tax=Phialocephala subalpina TaxID=576137 RepID=A0A1L7X4M5_9HELO|nr:uncharacterized protein PAC_09871 [Phialocephala subalpina]